MVVNMKWRNLHNVQKENSVNSEQYKEQNLKRNQLSTSICIRIAHDTSSFPNKEMVRAFFSIDLPFAFTKNAVL